MNINTKIVSFLVVSFFFVSLLFGVVAIVGLSRDQQKIMELSTNEILEVSRGLIHDSAAFFFSTLDRELQQSDKVTPETFRQIIMNMDPAYSKTVIVYTMADGLPVRGLDQASIGKFFDGDMARNFWRQAILRNGADLYLDNYDEFLRNPLATGVPVAVYSRAYKDSGVVVAFGRTMDAVRARIAYLNRKNAESFHYYVLVLMGVYLITTFITILLAIRFMRRTFLFPLRTIEDGVSRVARGDLSARIPLQTDDEIGSLASKVNYMTRELQRTTTSIESLHRESAERERAEHELQITLAQLLQSEKMASLGQLAAGVAHEINNPAGFVMSNVDTLKQYARSLETLITTYEQARGLLVRDRSAEARRVIETIDKVWQEERIGFILEDLPSLLRDTYEGTERIRRIVQDLRSFSHADKGKRDLTDINELLDTTLNIAWNEIKYKARVIREYGTIPLTMCFPQPLSQVFMNLIINASQAVEKDGEIRIKTYQRDDNIFVEVVDNGCGMTEEVQDHLFEPFFTTKPVGEGTGLGLSLAWNIMQRHGGEIIIHSRAGEGTACIVRIPHYRPEVPPGV